MLRYLDLHFVGPSPHMRLDFAQRLNLLTGDNSLGKTFLLDVAWWALTQTWPGKEEKEGMAWPLPGRRREATIASSFDAKTVSDVSHRSVFDPEKEQWPLRRGRPGSPGLVLYLRIDGGFSLWDPARNYWKRLDARGYENQDRPKAFLFNMGEIWDGLRANGNVFCEGLLADWKTWKDRNGNEYALLRNVLRTLSPHSQEPLEPGELTRLSISDVRDIPTLSSPYGPVPVTVASAAVKRILGLAYLITWAHTEHLRACQLIGDSPTDRFVVLIDEVELHLHPQWQRQLLPAVLHLVQGLGAEGTGQAGSVFPHVQMIASTHAPLVMASVESDFRPELDRVFHLHIEGEDVIAEDMPWCPQGDAVGWLVSEVFGLRQARSQEAERAIEIAEAYMRDDRAALPAELTTQEAIHAELLRVLPGHDHFWPRWVVATERR